MGTIVRHPTVEDQPDEPGDLPVSGAGRTAGAPWDVRRSAAAVRDVHAVRRRLQRLAASVPDAPPSSQRLLEEALVCLDRLADDLAYHHRSEQRRLQESIRRHGPAR
jgi:hypothetical protein